MGCHIISSYAWDINKLKQLTDEEVAELDDPEVISLVNDLQSASPYRRLDTFAGFITLGSNMPLFTFMFGPDKVYPITRFPDHARMPAFPGVRLPNAIKLQARWLNFYSPSDLLGYPLKPLNSAYNQEVRLADEEVESEGYWRARLIPSSLNAFKAHTGYWTNSEVIWQTARLIKRVITADEEKSTKSGPVLWKKLAYTWQ